MSKSKLHEKYKLDAYNHRDVMSLTPLSKWSFLEENIQKTHNRILQPGFMHRDAYSVINDAKMTGTEWLTDVCCPSAQAATMIQISKEMVVNYQVEESDLNTKAHAVYVSLINDTATLRAIEEEVDEKIRAFSEERVTLEEAARSMLNRNLSINYAAMTEEQLEAAKNLVLDMERRKMLDFIVSKMVKSHLIENASTLGLRAKTRYDIGTTHDFVFLGAAGSGKSSLVQQYVSDGSPSKKTDKIDCVILATDNYRAFTLPGAEAHEALQTKDVFIKTQDIAYMVKEQVEIEIEKGMKQDQKRPNLICDCITLDKTTRQLLAQNDPERGGVLISVVAGYRGEPGYVGIAERTDSRARNPDADPANKGRFIETTSLFKGHVYASQYLLSSIPENTITEVFDTDFDRERGVNPIKIAIIDSKNHTLDITNLRRFSEFLNKKNINVEAQHPVELILKRRRIREEKPLVTAPENKAKAILDMVTGKPSYAVTLKDENGTAYASLISDGGEKVRLQVMDLATFKKQADRSSSPEAQVLREITRQTAVATSLRDESLGAAVIEACESIDERLDSEESFLRNESARCSSEKSQQRERELEVIADKTLLTEYKEELKQLRLSEHEKEPDLTVQEGDRLTSSPP